MNIIISTFVPEGIVLGTLAISELQEKVEIQEAIVFKEKIIDNIRHSKLLFGKYGIVFYGEGFLNDQNFLICLDEFELKYKSENLSFEHIPDLLLQYFSEIRFSVICYLAGYIVNKQIKFEQQVYLISLSEGTCERINTDKDSKQLYHYHICGQNQLVARLLGNIKVQQGKEWIEITAPQIDCQMFSLEQSKIFILYILSNIINYSNLQNGNFNHSPQKELVVINRTQSNYIEMI
mgnify:CR=1 FL=1